MTPEDDLYPLIPPGHDLSEAQRETLQEEIREEAQRLFDERSVSGKTRSPQDDWAEAEARVLARRGISGSDGTHHTPQMS
jgi:hypothetical protein